MNLLLTCPIAAAYLGFSQGLRSQKIQAVLLAVGAMAALSIPIDFMVEASSWRPVLVFITILATWYLPVLFAYLAHPHWGMQTKIQKHLRIAIALLFIVNIFLGG